MAVRMATVLATATYSHQFPANGRQGSHDFADGCSSPALRCNWRPLLCGSRHPLRSSDNNGIDLGFGRTHTGVPHRQLATCSLSNSVLNSMERIDSARWAALMSVQVPVWIGVAPASGEEILEQIKGEAEEAVLVNGDGSQFITVLLYSAIAGLSLLTVGGWGLEIMIHLIPTYFSSRALNKRENTYKKKNLRDCPVEQVIYLAVTEFLEKRERDKLLKEEEGKKKKGNKTGKVKIAKSGPRGFGQKLQEDD